MAGGHESKTGYLDGRCSIRSFGIGDAVLSVPRQMSFRRWYPSVTTLPDGTVLIMGGEWCMVLWWVHVAVAVADPAAPLHLSLPAALCAWQHGAHHGR